MGSEDCLLCRVSDADAHFNRRRVWEDEYWRLSVVLHGPVPGFAHLEPHRHIPFVTDLDGPGLLRPEAEEAVPPAHETAATAIEQALRT